MKFFATCDAIARVYDIIGDIHGHASALTGLLHHMGYRRRGGAWRHPDNSRRVVFVGDFIDRGPEIPETLTLVRAMLDADSASAVMGNHEYNALIWHTPDDHGGWLRAHDDIHRNQHRATLEQFGLNPETPEGMRGLLDGERPRTPGARRLQDELHWMRTLPLYLENSHFRVVHAAWEDNAVLEVGTDPRAMLDDRFLYRSAYAGYPESRAVEILLKGEEIYLPAGASYVDKDGARRFKTRIRWWINPATPLSSMAEIAMPPADRDLGHLPIGSEETSLLFGYSDSRPVFIGHYWFQGHPRPLTSHVACLDYSVARGGSLCAYRFDGEPRLRADKFVAVTPEGRPIL